MPATRLAATWLPVVAWAAVIFALSSIPSLGTGLGVWDVVLRKLAHLTEFAILGALLTRAVAPLAAFALGVIYAVTDEVHQHFVPGRAGRPVDVAIDALGVAIGIAALRHVAARRASDDVQPVPSAAERSGRRAGGTAPGDP
ncbi:MAG: VanZ family protein [Thermoleophilia bacterium]|nr:VanZ family protein [Thermoleophilia bacterium]